MFITNLLNMLNYIQKAFFSALFVIVYTNCSAVSFSEGDFLSWLTLNQSSIANFSAGDVVHYADKEKFRPFVPPGYIDILFFDKMEFMLQPSKRFSPSIEYQQATNLFSGRPFLDESGLLRDYQAGEPFNPSSLNVNDKFSGYKAVWNFNYRWQRQGLEGKNSQWIWVRKGGEHSIQSTDEEFKGMYLGGGKFERILNAKYKRVYFNSRADLSKTNYKIKGQFGQDEEYREVISFYAPFDIKDTAYLTIRYLDAEKSDDAWAYIPSTRRVRRVSADSKSDSLLGTDHTLEDFYCFSGRIDEHTWKYYGVARILAVAQSKRAAAFYYGPDGWTANDDWQIKEVDVFAQIPKRKNHPYSVKYIMTDRDNHHAYYCNAFDRSGVIWKVWQQSKLWSEDSPARKHAKQRGFDVDGLNIPVFQSSNAIDLQAERGTIVNGTIGGYPLNKSSKIKREMDVNKLTEGH